jgi:hypothetical protein
MTMSALSPRQMFLLDEACRPIRQAFGTAPYLVGTAGERGPYRDVDVRLMLDDFAYDQLGKLGPATIPFLGLAVGEYLAARTGLPIDFQIQRTAEANAAHSGQRNPLGVRTLANYGGDAPMTAEATKETTDHA